MLTQKKKNNLLQLKIDIGRDFRGSCHFVNLAINLLNFFLFHANIRGLSPPARYELLHNIDPFVVAPMTYDDTTGESGEWTVNLDTILSEIPQFDRFNTNMQAALRVGEWKIQTGPGGLFYIH